MIEELIWSRAEELSKQEKQKELDCVLKSATFARSEQLRSFLLYVCRMEMDGRAGDLNEYLVGVEALGRPASYSPAEDSSVRSRAWELRQKLLKLYGTERRDSPLRIDLPRGGYTPQYLVCAPGTDDEVHVQHEIALPERHGELTYPFPPLTRTSPRSSRRAALIGIFSGLAVALIVLGANYLWKARTTALDGIDPVIRQAWGPLLDPGSPDMLLMANGLYLLIRPNASPSFIASRKYKVPAEIYEEYQKKRPLAPDKKLMMFSSDNVVQMGYINGLVTVSGILQRTRQPFSTVPERVVTPSAIRNRNVILFGAPQDSTAATELLSTGAYHFSYDSVHDIVIRKGNIPRSDSPYYRTPTPVSAPSVTYGLITVMPSLGADSQWKRTVVFSGITSVGAQGASEFFSSSRYMKELLNHFRQAGLAGFPPAYQVVVRCRAYDTLLVSFEYADSEVISQTR